MLPTELRERKARLQALFNDLSGTPEFVRMELVTLTTGEAVVRVRHNVRIRPAALRLVVW